MTKSDKDAPEDSSFVRLQLTVPRHQVEEIEAHADEYYNGNRSRMFRSAVKNDQQQKDGVDTVELKLMRKKVESIDDTLADHSELLDAIQTQLQTLHAGTERERTHTNAVLSPNSESEDDQILHDIIEILGHYDQPLSMEEIVAEADHQLKSIHDAVTELLDKGILKSVGDSKSSIRYGLANTNQQTNE